VTRKQTALSARPRVEELESRHLPSITVNPFGINLKTTDHSHGVFTVRLLGDDAAAKALLSSGATLVFQVTDPSGKTVTLSKPLSVHLRNVNGIPEEGLKFRRSVLQGLSAGLAKIQGSLPSTTTTTGTTGTTGTTTGSTTPTETGFFFLFSPGGNKGPGHQSSGGTSSGGTAGKHGKHG
jgi:hypothetical protein